MSFMLSNKEWDFERARKKRTAALNLTPMIDIMFILIIFFMLTTTFMRIESLELNLPSVSAKAATDKGEVMHLFIQANGDMLLGSRKLDQDELTESMKRMFEKDTNTKVMLLTAEGVTMQQLVGIMDRVYLAGGRSLFVRKWDGAPASAKEPASPASVQVNPMDTVASADAAAALSPAAGTPATASAPAAPSVAVPTSAPAGTRKRDPAKPVVLH